jgi:mRNA interferase MazF
VKISQIRTLSTQRLGRKICGATDQELETIVEGLNEIIGAA